MQRISDGRVGHVYPKDIKVFVRSCFSCKAQNTKLGVVCKIQPPARRPPSKFANPDEHLTGSCI